MFDRMFFIKRYRGWIFKKPLPVFVAIVTFVCIFQFDLTVRNENEIDSEFREKFRRYSVNRGGDRYKVSSDSVVNVDTMYFWISKQEDNKDVHNKNSLFGTKLLKKIIDPEHEYVSKRNSLNVNKSATLNEYQKQSSKIKVKENLMKTLENVVLTKQTFDKQWINTLLTSHKSFTVDKTEQDVVEKRTNSIGHRTEDSSTLKIDTKVEALTMDSSNNKTSDMVTGNVSKSSASGTRFGLKVRPFSEFRYPLFLNVSELHENYTKYGKVNVKESWNFKINFLISSNKTCITTTDEGNMEAYEDDEILLLFIVKSTPKNYKRRDAIRQTWVSGTFVNYTNIRHIFTMGTTKDTSLRRRVDLEIRKFDDIVQMDFQDSYYNNTYKTVGAIQWVTKYCQNTKFIMFVDDDFYVATQTLIPFLRKIETNVTMNNLFLGNVIRNSKPWRQRRHRWYTPLEDYPFEVYPPFCSAGSIITSITFIKKLEFAIRYVKYFRYDDVYLGIVLYKMGVELQHTDMVRMWKVTYKDEKFKQILSSHGYEKPSELLKAFRCHVEKLCGPTFLEVFILLTVYVLLPVLTMSAIVWYLVCCIDSSSEDVKKIRYRIKKR